MIREQWSRHKFYGGSFPRFPCPHCTPGSVHAVKSSLVVEETPASKRGHSHEAWGPEWILKHFSLRYQCTNPSCKGFVFVLGYSELNDEEGDWTDVFTPTVFLPAPPIIAVPPDTPEEIAEDIRASHYLFWADPPAAGNRVRVAVEKILSAQKVRRFSVNNGKRRRLRLADRIKLFASKNKEIADRFDAIRWIGNDASHDSGLSRGDVLDALEILECALDDLYRRDAKRIEDVVRDINRRKAPRSTSRARKRRRPR